MKQKLELDSLNSARDNQTDTQLAEMSRVLQASIFIGSNTQAQSVDSDSNTNVSKLSDLGQRLFGSKSTETKGTQDLKVIHRIELICAQLRKIATDNEEVILKAPFIGNGPEKETIVSLDVYATGNTAVMLHSFFSTHKELIPAGIELNYPKMENK